MRVLPAHEPEVPIARCKNRVIAMNWLQVLGSTKFAQIDESEGHQFEPKMSNPESLKT
jgi:hypothetical protein